MRNILRVVACAAIAGSALFVSAHDVSALTSPPPVESRQRDAVASAAVTAFDAYRSYLDHVAAEPADDPLVAATTAAVVLDSWATSLHELAVLVSPDRAAELTATWSAAGPDRLTVVLAALAQSGSRYAYASSDPARGFDCSGLTGFAWRQVGIELEPSSSAQRDTLVRVERSDALPGDVVWYPGHVMLFLGADLVVHASTRSRPVGVDEIRRADLFLSPLPPLLP